MPRTRKTHILIPTIAGVSQTACGLGIEPDPEARYAVFSRGVVEAALARGVR